MRVSNPGKVFFPQAGFTKLDLLNYYLECHEEVVRHLRERPTVMKRWVNGVEGEPFFQKRVPDSAPEWLQTATVTFPSGRHARELVPNDAAHLAWGVNLGVIDWNPWPVRRGDLDHPDELRVDLDPGPECPSRRCAWSPCACARCSRSTACAAFPKTSGSRGMHIYVRTVPEHSFEEVRRAALALAREVERRMPGRATSRWWKEEREGVFIDYNQNARDRTVASAYSRARGLRCARLVPAGLGGGLRRRSRRAAARHRARRGCASVATRARDIDEHARLSRRRCWSWPRATSARASATRPGRRISASRRASPSVCSRVVRGR